MSSAAVVSTCRGTIKGYWTDVVAFRRSNGDEPPSAFRGAPMPFSLDLLVFWHWFALGALLIVLELLVPGVIFLWLGIAAFSVGIILFLVPGFGWEVQLIMFGIVATVTTIGGHRIAPKREPPPDEIDLARRAEKYIGGTYVLEDTTLNGRGKMGVGDTLWSVFVNPPGTDLFKGARVTVIDVDGATLIVESTGDREPIGPHSER
jgi:inner membrane protein